MIENNLRANKHIHYTYTDKDLIDSLRSNQGIPENQDIIMAFNSGCYGPDYLVFDYENNAVFEYTDIDAKDWVKMIKIPNLARYTRLVEYLKSSIFTFDYRVNPSEELEFRLTTLDHGTYTVRLDGEDDFAVIYRLVDGQPISSNRFAFDDIVDVDAFDIELIKLTNFEYEVRNDRRNISITLRKVGQNFDIIYHSVDRCKTCPADLSKNKIYQLTKSSQQHSLEFMLIFNNKEITDLYLKQWIKVTQLIHLPTFNDILLENLKNNKPFLEWK